MKCCWIWPGCDIFYRRRNIPLASIQGFEITWLCFSTGHTYTYTNTHTEHGIKCAEKWFECMYICIFVYNTIQCSTGPNVYMLTSFAHGYVCTVHGVRLYLLDVCLCTHTDYVIDEALKRFLFFSLCLALHFSNCAFLYPPHSFVLHLVCMYIYIKYVYINVCIFVCGSSTTFHKPF